MAASAPRARQRLTGLLLGVAALVVLVLAITVVALLLRPAEPATTAAAAQTPAPVALQPAPSSTPSAPGQQQRRYRAYVSTAVTNGTALAAAIGELQDCRLGRSLCRQRIAEARNQVDQFQRALSADPAPACLSVADQRLHDGLSFEGRGLGLAEQAIEARNRVKLVQGLLLVTVGTWREGQAVWAARHSDC